MKTNRADMQAKLLQNHTLNATDDFFDQIFSAISARPELTKSHYDLAGAGGDKKQQRDESLLLVARLRQQQMSSDGALLVKSLAVPIAAQQQEDQLVFSDLTDSPPVLFGGIRTGADSDSSFKSPDSTRVGFGASDPQHFYQHQCTSIPQQNFGGSPSLPACSAVEIASPRRRIRARRGQATDPHSIAERHRRERIVERMKALQELVPNTNKTDKASMLDEIIEYVKFLQLQVKVLSMSRLGEAPDISPFIADVSSKARGSLSASSETISTDNLVAKLMEGDMGSAMQYLQGKGLCLMPISFASAISALTSTSAPTTSAPVDVPPVVAEHVSAHLCFSIL